MSLNKNPALVDMFVGLRSALDGFHFFYEPINGMIHVLPPLFTEMRDRAFFDFWNFNRADIIL
jgi:hypothetical protein